MENQIYYSGLAPLAAAVITRDMPNIKSLLAQCVDLEVKFFDAETALHMAAKEGYADIVNILLEYGANIEAINHEGK